MLKGCLKPPKVLFANQDCILDYLLIPNGRANASLSGRSFDRFCGGQLNTETKSEWSTPIYQHVSTPEFTWLQV